MRILTWNVRGGDENALAATLPLHAIDLCVLQEAPRQANSSWYVPLAAIPGYNLQPPIPENEAHHLAGGGTLQPDSQIRAYAVLSRNATIPVPPVVQLVDYTADAYWGPRTPANVFDAEQKGYNQRPPLRLQFQFAGQPVTVFTWHAPQGMWNRYTLSMFDHSATLAEAQVLGNRTVIAGDLNTITTAGYFSNFAGLQQQDTKLDYVLANVPLGAVAEIPGINLRGDAHWAIAAQVP